MNVKLIEWVWRQSKTNNGHDLLVLLALAHRADLHGDVTVKLAELAQDCRTTHSGDEIRDSLRVAIKLREIEILQNIDEHGNRLPNTYHFTICKPVPPAPKNGDNIEFEDPPLPGIPPPKVRDLPQHDPPKKLMMDAAALAAIAADPTYRDLDVNRQAWKFRRWCEAQVPKRDQTVRAFKTWLSKV